MSLIMKQADIDDGWIETERARWMALQKSEADRLSWRIAQEVRRQLLAAPFATPEAQVVIRDIYLNDIVQTVCDAFNVDADMMLSRRKDARMALARHVIFFIAREVTHYSLPEIGRFMNRDHTTVMHGIRRIEQLIENQSPIAKKIGQLMVTLRAH